MILNSQKKRLPKIKKDLTLVRYSGELLDFSLVPSQTLQDVCQRVEQAFERFIKGDKGGKLKVWLKLRLHRPLPLYLLSEFKLL